MSPTARVGRFDRRRGAATVEFAVSMLVFIPALLYSIFLADTLFFQLKAQEITAAAAWDLTGRTLHDYSSSFDHASKYTAAASATQSAVEKRYKGLDAWANEGGGGASSSDLVGAGAKGSLKNGSVSCKLDASVGGGSGDISPLPSIDPSSAAFAGVKLHTGGFVRCQAEVESQNWFLGTGKPSQHFMDGPTWLGQVALYDATAIGKISLCGVGTASGGSCGTGTASFGIMTDDWGLAADGTSNGSDSHTHWADGSQNTDTDFYDSSSNSMDFYRVGKEVYENSVPTGGLGALGVPAVSGLTYNRAVQLAEAGYATGGSYAEIGELALIDVAYGAFLLNERSPVTDKPGGGGGASGDPAMLKDTPNNLQQIEHGEQSPQYSDTWPFYLKANSSIAPLTGNAYYKAWRARTENYLGM